MYVHSCVCVVCVCVPACVNGFRVDFIGRIIRPKGDDPPHTVQKKGMLLTWRWFRYTVGEGISCISFRTSAHWRVIDDAALGSCTARSRTRVPTLLPHARSVAGTFRVNAAFRPAVGRNSHVISKARARRSSSNISALRVGSARRRHARVHDHWRRWTRGWCYKNTGK
jgi:hypothetical protein